MNHRCRPNVLKDLPRGVVRCTECSQVLQNQASLDAHFRRKHTRPYKCVFHFAGCECTFASKNEWKRHVSSQHIILHYWLCQEGECAAITNARPGAQRQLENGVVLNRKDLFAQHTRRMHIPRHIKPGFRDRDEYAFPLQEWEDMFRRFEERAVRERCKLPERLLCPALGCLAEFRGWDAWDQRMEHVARHLDRAADGQEPHVNFGGDNDTLLLQWASSPEVNIVGLQDGKWTLTRQSSVVLHKISQQPEEFRYPARERAARKRTDGNIGLVHHPPDSAYGSMVTTATQWKGHQMKNVAKASTGLAVSGSREESAEEDCEGEKLETYSTASTLGGKARETYVSEFAEELRSAFPSAMDKAGWDRISPNLGDILKEFSVRIAYEDTLADRAICRKIMYLVHNCAQVSQVKNPTLDTCMCMTKCPKDFVFIFIM